MKKALCMLLILITFTLSFATANPAIPPRDGYVEGYLIRPIGDHIEIEAYNGDIYVLPIDVDILYTIDQVPVHPDNFKVGMEVYLEVRGRHAVYVEGFSTSNLGYIAPGSRMRSGYVQEIDRDQIVVRDARGERETYYISPGTIILKKGQNVPLSTLYVGDRVRLHFDEVDTQIVSKMLIQGDGIVVQNLYRGNLQQGNGVQNIVTLENLQVFRNGRWEDVRPIARLPYVKENPLYIGGYQVPYENLRHYNGRTAYLAVQDFFGREQVAQMVINSQYETIYSDKISEINWYTEAFELNNNRNFSFNEGTIIIQNGRLVDRFTLQPNSDAFVIADTRGSQRMAGVVYVHNEAINHSNAGQYYLYAGRLDQIVEDQVILKDFFMLNENEWESFEGEKELFYDHDTIIYDIEANEYVTPEAFYTRNYAVDEDSSYVRRNNLRDWYAYLYTDGDRIVSVSVQKNMDSLLPQRVTNGIVAAVEADHLVGWTLDLRDAQDWSGRLAKWMPKATSIRINLEDTMIIQGNQRIEPQELNRGDRLYMVRDDFYGKVIIVK